MFIFALNGRVFSKIQSDQPYSLKWSLLILIIHSYFRPMAVQMAVALSVSLPKSSVIS